ncbi:DUF5018-related domain-containing protein [Paraflavitalea pollutisoli]|uniref:DUF5018-related domain-containing protein n=1 Tax=Paraflavitalea pollutisoli TaxID=3034143 RepID=UPI0023ED20D0|nr:hypothetical protein [Paraflavitalea sp. H1-2-19X]
MKTLIKRNMGKLLLALAALSLTGCLKNGYEGLKNSSDKALTAVNYTYRFLYNDTIQKGTPQQEIQLDRVCEVVFSKTTTAIEVNGMKGFSTTIKHSLSSVMKAGPTGSVTTQQLYNEFVKRIQTEQLSNLWVYVTISDVAKLTPQGKAPQLGKPGDFTQDQVYRVTAADGTYQDYVLRTVKGF